jgi:hypothetical protein
MQGRVLTIILRVVQLVREGPLPVAPGQEEHEQYENSQSPGHRGIV